MRKGKKIRLSEWQLLALGFMTVILLGSALLCLPWATAEGETPYIDALFVATSATCVTGLIPCDTGTHWTVFGQVVILLLIQTGGLGFMTFVSLAVSMFGKKMGLYGKTVLLAASGGSDFASLKYMIKRIVLGTALFEGIGAALLSIRFIRDFGVGRGIYYAVFHSVSAFCNAGFDVLGGEFGKYCSLTHYATDPIVSLTICGLIIIGGLGFCVWSDVWDCKFRWKKLRLHSKIVLSVTGGLLLVSTILFLIFERNNVETADYTFGGKLLVAIFNATTPRTAGFNTIDMTGLSDSGYLLTVMLMSLHSAVYAEDPVTADGTQETITTTAGQTTEITGTTSKNPNGLLYATNNGTLTVNGDGALKVDNTSGASGKAVSIDNGGKIVFENTGGTEISITGNPKMGEYFAGVAVGDGTIETADNSTLKINASASSKPNGESHGININNANGLMDIGASGAQVVMDGYGRNVRGIYMTAGQLNSDGLIDIDIDVDTDVDTDTDIDIDVEYEL